MYVSSHAKYEANQTIFQFMPLPGKNAYKHIYTYNTSNQYKTLIYDLTKKLFHNEIISMSWSIYIPIFMKIGDKTFFESKITKGVSLQVFLGPPKKKIFI